ncbi:MAG: TIGR04222 domain-containing membrane protein [Pseudomonadota bacterium]
MQLFETWTGADFLVFYGVMLLTCVGLSFWISANLRPEGRIREVEDPEELAVLAGGRMRYTLAVLADLFAQGALGAADKRRVKVSREQIETSQAGQAVLRKVGAFSISEASASLGNHAQRAEESLIRQGLLLDNSDWIRLRALTISPLAALLVLGLYRQQAGMVEGEPTGFLIMMMLATAAIGAWRFARVSRRTIGGERLLKNWVDRSSRLSRAPESHEVKWAVSLYGTSVLAGTPFAHVHAMHKAAASSAAGNGGCGGGAGGDGGGGGCGGGCGGCGG